MGKSRHQIAHANAARNQVAKRQERPNLLYRQVGELGFKFLTISYEYDPRDCAVGAGKRSGGRERPILRLWKKRLVVEILEDKSRPWSHPRFDHEDFPSRAKAPGSLPKKLTHIGQVVQHISKNDSSERPVAERDFLRVNYELRRGEGENLR